MLVVNSSWICLIFLTYSSFKQNAFDTTADMYLLRYFGDSFEHSKHFFCETWKLVYFDTDLASFYKALQYNFTKYFWPPSWIIIPVLHTWFLWGLYIGSYFGISHMQPYTTNTDILETLCSHTYIVPIYSYFRKSYLLQTWNL